MAGSVCRPLSGVMAGSVCRAWSYQGLWQGQSAEPGLIRGYGRVSLQSLVLSGLWQGQSAEPGKVYT